MARVVVFCMSPPTPEGREQCREGEGRVQEVSEAIASTHHTGTGHLNLPLTGDVIDVMVEQQGGARGL